MVGRLWWTPEPQPLLFSTSSITHRRLPRDLRYSEPVLVHCASCDGNRGHLLHDVYRLLARDFHEYERTGKAQTTTLPR